MSFGSFGLTECSKVAVVVCGPGRMSRKGPVRHTWICSRLDAFQLLTHGWISGPHWILKDILFRQRNLQCTMNYNLVHASFIHIYYLYIHPQSLQMNYILVTSLQAASILELSYLAWRTKPASFGANSSGNVSPQHPKWTPMIVDDFLGSSTLPQTNTGPTRSQGEVVKLVRYLFGRLCCKG